MTHRMGITTSTVCLRGPQQIYTASCRALTSYCAFFLRSACTSEERWEKGSDFLLETVLPIPVQIFLEAAALMKTKLLSEKIK